MQTLPVCSGSPSLESLRVLFIGGYWMSAMDVVRMYLCGIQDLGASVVEYCTDHHLDALDHGSRPYDRGSYGPTYLKWEALRPIVEQHDPHLIVCCAGGLAFHPEVAQELRRTRCLIGLAMSDPDVFTLSTSVISPSFDHFFTNHLGTVARHREVGANAHWLPFPCYPKFHHRRSRDTRFACDVIVAGHGREDRADLIRPLVRAFRVKVFGTSWADHGIEATDLNLAPTGLIGAAFSSATIGLDFARNFSGLPIAKLRLFEIAGCGAIPCTEYSEELPHLFDDSEILTFCTALELEEKVRRVIGDPALAAAMQRNVYWQAHSRHTVEHRWRYILEQCGVGSAR
jgi:hypothetical protein